MKLATDTNLKWQNGIDTDHEVTLSGNAVLDEIFESDNPAAELTARAGDIHRNIVMMLVNTHVRDLLTKTGQNASVPGKTNYESDIDSENSWSFDDQSRLENAFSMRIRVQTDRRINAVQAADNAIVAIAETIAHQLVGALKKKILNVDATAIQSTSRLVNGQLVEYDAREVAPTDEPGGHKDS